MLNPTRLESELKTAFEECLPGAFERAFMETMPEKSKAAEEKAKQFGETIKELLAEDLAKRIAGAIDYYVKNANVYGTIITMGSPFTQTAVVNTPSPVTGGKIPNQLGIM